MTKMNTKGKICSVILGCALLSTASVANSVEIKEVYVAKNRFPGYCYPESWDESFKYPAKRQRLLRDKYNFYCDKDGNVIRHYKRYYDNVKIIREEVWLPDDLSQPFAYRLVEWDMEPKSSKAGYNENYYLFKDKEQDELIGKRYEKLDKIMRQPKYTQQERRVYQENIDKVWYGKLNTAPQLLVSQPIILKPISGVRAVNKPTVKITTSRGRSPTIQKDEQYDLFVEVSEPLYLYCYIHSKVGTQQIYPVVKNGSVISPQPVQSIFRSSQYYKDDIILTGSDLNESLFCMGYKAPRSARIDKRLNVINSLAYLPVKDMQELLSVLELYHYEYAAGDVLFLYNTLIKKMPGCG